MGEARNTYVYAASGTKLRVVKKYNTNYNTSPVIGSAVNVSAMDASKTTDYVGNKIFENGVLNRILVDGGFIDCTNGSYQFYITDHLGNNRMVMREGGIVMERNDYYPFGMRMAHYADANASKYKYRNKELDVMHGLNLYDFAARMQDPTLGKFTTVDPLAERKPWLSPYIYCSDNPLTRIDSDGQWDVEVHAYNNRTKSGYAVLIVRDNGGKEVYRTVVKTIGTGGRVRNVSKSDTPQGTYNILGWRKTGDGTNYNRTSFGPNDLLALDYQGGEGGNRNGMHVHGGRQEGKYKERKNLASTHGCMRINDDDIKNMKNVTSELEKADPAEKAGKLTLADDLKTPVSYDNDRHSAGNSQFPISSNNEIEPMKITIPNIELPVDNTYVKKIVIN